MRDHDPDPVNWNALFEAYSTSSTEELLAKTFEAGPNSRGMYFTVNFEIQGRGLWASLTPETRDRDRKGKFTNVIRHTNMRKSRWLKLKAA